MTPRTRSHHHARPADERAAAVQARAAGPFTLIVPICDTVGKEAVG